MCIPHIDSFFHAAPLHDKPDVFPFLLQSVPKTQMIHKVFSQTGIFQHRFDIPGLAVAYDHQPVFPAQLFHSLRHPFIHMAGRRLDPPILDPVQIGGQKLLLLRRKLWKQIVHDLVHRLSKLRSHHFPGQPLRDLGPSFQGQIPGVYNLILCIPQCSVYVKDDRFHIYSSSNFISMSTLFW